uniref:Uncharacterized protein n=1 Tax=Arundo donax TaxID=35708 RepID=A0A0A9G751_ARUDO
MPSYNKPHRNHHLQPYMHDASLEQANRSN